MLPSASSAEFTPQLGYVPKQVEDALKRLDTLLPPGTLNAVKTF